MENNISFIIDIDGTICPNKRTDEKYEDLIPYPGIVNRIKEYHDNGAKIILFTARNMNSYNGNLGLINKITAKILIDWLDKWQIPYDEIIYGKPWPGHVGFYVDDRTVRPDEFLKCSLDELNYLCNQSRNHTN